MHAMTWKHLRPFPPLPVAAFVLTVSATLQAADTTKPVKVFILAGDANCLEQGAVSGRTDGKDGVFFPNGNPVKDEVGRHVNGAVYQGASKAGTHYDTLTPEWTGLIGLGDNQSAKRKPKPFAPFPELAFQDGHTTVLRGYLTVPRAGEEG
jgi:hypothetical protein